MDQSICMPLDVESAYQDAKNMNDPVLIWSGDLTHFDFSHDVRFIIRMTGLPSREGEPEKFVTLDRVVYKPHRESEPSCVPPTLSRISIPHLECKSFQTSSNPSSGIITQGGLGWGHESSDHLLRD